MGGGGPEQPRTRTWRRLSIGLAAAVALGAASAAQALQPGDLPGCPARAAPCIALALWLPGDDDPRGWLADQLDTANRLLGAIGAGVQVTEIHRLPPGDGDIASTAQRTRLGRHGDQAPLRWFVVRRLVDDADPTRTRRGVTWRDGPRVWVIEDGAANA